MNLVGFHAVVFLYKLFASELLMIYMYGYLDCLTLIGLQFINNQTHTTMIIQKKEKHTENDHQENDRN